jgi:hypothetical protein
MSSPRSGLWLSRLCGSLVLASLVDDAVEFTELLLRRPSAAISWSATSCRANFHGTGDGCPGITSSGTPESGMDDLLQQPENRPAHPPPDDALSDRVWALLGGLDVADVALGEVERAAELGERRAGHKAKRRPRQ